jgi:hypothetical protein
MGYRIFYSDTAMFSRTHFTSPERAIKAANGSNFSLYRYAEDAEDDGDVSGPPRGVQADDGRKLELVGFWTPTTGYVEF